jgi:CRP/FNR family cyclic AMP-dependent transcriptional regulator
MGAQIRRRYRCQPLGDLAMSYENDIRQQASSGQQLPGKVDLGVLRYLWQAGPFSFNEQENIPKFLARVPVLNSFSDNELRIFSGSLHQRRFSAGETVFRQGDVGYGFYFVFSGVLEVIHQSGPADARRDHPVARLERYQYFGEMGLLQDYNRRNASVVAAEDSVLLGLFKPDLEALLDRHPVVGAKFLREVSLILANRLGALMDTVTHLRHRLGEHEGPT